jgi:hypothetical protein
MSLTREEQIKLLSEHLLKLLAEEDIEQIKPQIDTSSTYIRGNGYPKPINETLEDFKRMNIDINVVRAIMKRADELKGRTDLYTTKQGLYEMLDKLIK